VKRIHLVGISKDGKRLVFAQKKGAKFGSLEAPVSAKLLKVIDEAREAREAKKKPARAEADTTPDETAAEGASTASTAVPAADSDAGDPGAPAPIGLVASDQIDIPASDQIDIPVMPGRRRKGQPAEVPLPGIVGQALSHPSVGLAEPQVPDEAVARIERIRPRTEKPEIPARSRLTPAEIQALIRSGRGIRAVAKTAGTPVDWVRYLAEPIQEERRGIVRQMLTRRQERARLGLSALTIGDAILENLRSRGLRAAETVMEEGFTAFRPDGREWRVRLVFQHRGRRYTASWSFDAQTRQVTPLNSLATSLGWRRPPGQDDEEGRQPPRPRRTSTTRGRRRTLKSRARKPAATRRKRSTTSSARVKRRRSRG
jgi:hypothetical protein